MGVKRGLSWHVVSTLPFLRFWLDAWFSVCREKHVLHGAKIDSGGCQCVSILCYYQSGQHGRRLCLILPSLRCHVVIRRLLRLGGRLFVLHGTKIESSGCQYVSLLRCYQPGRHGRRLGLILPSGRRPLSRVVLGLPRQSPWAAVPRCHSPPSAPRRSTQSSCPWPPASVPQQSPWPAAPCCHTPPSAPRRSPLWTPPPS